MGSADQPFIYSPERLDDSRFPSHPFDPKAVTRASWEVPKPMPPKKDGPLISFNRHPDAHEVRLPRSAFMTLGPRTKWWIVATRRLQLVLRALELVAAIGVLFLMIVIKNVDSLTSWVVRITAGMVMMHSAYSLYHHAHPAGARTPASSAAYHVFSGVSDLCVPPLYAFGALAVRNQGEKWATLINDQSLMDYFTPSLYYTLIGSGGLHLVSMTISMWLALKFRQITRMPPDMNPLEDNLTSRRHQRNKSSVATTTTTESEKHLSTPLEQRRRSGTPCEDLPRPPSIPFYATRSPRGSLGSQDSRIDLPSREYQVTLGSSPKKTPRSSATSADWKRSSTPSASTDANRSPWRSSQGAYTWLPSQDLTEPRSPRSSASPPPVLPKSKDDYGSRPSTGTVASQVTIETNNYTAQPRAAKFTEAWYASESLINRTQERNRALNAVEAASRRREYQALHQQYNLPDEDSDDSDAENHVMDPDEDEDDSSDLTSQDRQGHPNPLRSNPSLAKVRDVRGPRLLHTPLITKAALSEVDLNDRRVSGSQDITDEKQHQGEPGATFSRNSPSKRYTWAPRNRNSSIQPDADFYSKPYGELKAATPPIMVGSERQVSSGVDYNNIDASRGGSQYFSLGRRNVSGKIAEEGLAGRQRGEGWSRYSALNN